jgi:hypothetical protein
MDVLTRKGYCGNKYTIMEATAAVSDGRIVSLDCPIRDHDAPCVYVDHDELSCNLFPEYPIDDRARYRKE